MKINLNKLKDAGYEVHIDDHEINIVPNGRNDDHGNLWKQLHHTLSPHLEDVQLEIVLQETVGNVQKHQIVSLFDI
jgi:hypothetical protein